MSVDIARVFIGYDRKETVAYHVLCHSIISRSSMPVSITPLNRANLGSNYHRPRGEFDSTDFSNSRWIVPHLCNHEGKAIFMDCDMLCLGDIADLWYMPMDSAVRVQKHNHVPEEDIKFLGQKQTKYSKKNWSSLMMFNNERCRPLTKHIVNTMSPGLWFHQFNWLDEEEIGGLPLGWNLLVGYDRKIEDPQLVHYTSGGPWHGYDCDYATEWFNEYKDMIDGDNPVRWREEAAESHGDVG